MRGQFLETCGRVGIGADVAEPFARWVEERDRDRASYESSPVDTIYARMGELLSVQSHSGRQLADVLMRRAVTSQWVTNLKDFSELLAKVGRLMGYMRADTDDEDLQFLCSFYGMGVVNAMLSSFLRKYTTADALPAAGYVSHHLGEEVSSPINQGVALMRSWHTLLFEGSMLEQQNYLVANLVDALLVMPDSGKLSDSVAEFRGFGAAESFQSALQARMENKHPILQMISLMHVIQLYIERQELIDGGKSMVASFGVDRAAKIEAARQLMTGLRNVVVAWVEKKCAFSAVEERRIAATRPELAMPNLPLELQDVQVVKQLMDRLDYLLDNHQNGTDKLEVLQNLAKAVGAELKRRLLESDAETQFIVVESLTHFLDSESIVQFFNQMVSYEYMSRLKIDLLPIDMARTDEDQLRSAIENRLTGHNLVCHLVIMTNIVCQYRNYLDESHGGAKRLIRAFSSTGAKKAQVDRLIAQLRGIVMGLLNPEIGLRGVREAIENLQIMDMPSEGKAGVIVEMTRQVSRGLLESSAARVACGMR